MENIDKIYDLLDSIEVTRENDIEIANIKKLLSAGNYLEALKKMRELKDKEEKTKKKQEELLEYKNPKEITQVGGNGNENAFSQIVNIFKK